MSNEFKRVPTCGENDVDLRVATEPRRASDRLTAYVQFHELAQGYRAATPDGAQAAYEKLCAFLEGRAVASSVDRNSVLEEAAKVCDFGASWAKGEMDDDTNSDSYRNDFAERYQQSMTDAKGIRALKSAAPQPVDAARAVPVVVRADQCTEMQRNAVYMALHYYMNVANPDEYKATDEAIAAFLAAAPSPAAQPATQAVPEEFVLAPIKATAVMIAAYNTAPSGFAGSPAYGGHVWEAMLAAAPVAQPTDTTKGA